MVYIFIALIIFINLKPIYCSISRYKIYLQYTGNTYFMLTCKSKSSASVFQENLKQIHTYMVMIFFSASILYVFYCVIVFQFFYSQEDSHKNMITKCFICIVI